MLRLAKTKRQVLAASSKIDFSSLNLRTAENTKLINPAVYSNYDTDYQLLKHDLKRLFPEKFEIKNRSYINICSVQKSENVLPKIDVHCEFEKYHKSANMIFPKGRPSNQKLTFDWNSKMINLMDENFCQQFLQTFYINNSDILANESFEASEIEIESLNEISAVLRLNRSSKFGGSHEIMVQVNHPLLILETPAFHPLLTYNIKVPILFTANIYKKYDKIVLHSDNYKKNDFEIVDLERFYHEPESLKSNVVLLALDQNLPNSTPIYLSPIIHNRIPSPDKKWWFEKYDLEKTGKFNLIEPFYKKREWKVFEQPKSPVTSHIKIISYNMLMSNLAKSSAKETRTKEVASWNHLEDTPEIEFPYRKQLLYNEIIHYDADILCFQESETRAIPTIKYEFIESFNSVKGQASLVTAYNPERFELIEHATTTFHSIASMKEAITLAGKNHRFLVCYFEDKLNDNKPIIVVNTHLYWADTKVRTMQFNLLIREMDKIRGDQGNEKIPILICGDFNMNLKKSVKLPKSKIKANKYDNFQLATRNNSGGVHYSTKLKSGFCERLDWLLYKNTEHIGYLSNVDDEYVVENGYMPSKMFPSDHFAQGFIVEV